MRKDQRHEVRLRWVLLTAACLMLHASFFVSSCARMGSPDGGWYDETPPYVVSASPADKSTGVKSQKVNIYFNEFIKIEDAQSKVIVSPPQLEQAEIKAAGKRIVVELKDTLKENTTYTVDFSDAISDNNEGNPMGNYTYCFSTGEQIDTFEVAGYVLNAEDLEPVKGILVGLYDDLSDSAFKTKPMVRVSRTDSRGHFVVKGVAPGTYRAYALQDADGDFVYNQKSEMLAFSHDTFEPSAKPDIRQDTLWRDTLHIDVVERVPYTHFLPDDLTLLAFTAKQTDRHLLKTERATPEKLGLYFTYGDSLPPRLRGLNFNADSAFIVEANEQLDTIFYWLRDTMLVNQDTLRIELQYQETDTLGALYLKTDTIEALPKVSYERRMKEQAKEYEKWQKEQEKKRKREEPYDTVMAVKPLQLNVTPSGSLAPDEHLKIEVPAPLARYDTAAIHLYVKVDTLWYDEPFLFQPVEGKQRLFELLAAWEPGTEYSLEIDSAAFSTIYGLENQATKSGIKVTELDKFSTLSVTLTGTEDTCLVVQLLNKSGTLVKQTRAGQSRVADFFYVRPGEYFLSAFADRNGNGRWDTGDYDANKQPEDVYFYTAVAECKEKWDISLTWNLTARRRFEQKPAALVKQKGEQAKKQRNRNAERAKEKGIQYIQEKTGVRL